MTQTGTCFADFSLLMGCGTPLLNLPRYVVFSRVLKKMNSDTDADKAIGMHEDLDVAVDIAMLYCNHHAITKPYREM